MLGHAEYVSQDGSTLGACEIRQDRDKSCARKKDCAEVHKRLKRRADRGRALFVARETNPSSHGGDETPTAARSAGRCRSPGLPLNQSNRTSFSYSSFEP